MCHIAYLDCLSLCLTSYFVCHMAWFTNPCWLRLQPFCPDLIVPRGCALVVYMGKKAHQGALVLWFLLVSCLGGVDFWLPSLIRAGFWVAISCLNCRRVWFCSRFVGNTWDDFHYLIHGNPLDSLSQPTQGGWSLPIDLLRWMCSSGTHCAFVLGTF